MPTDVPKVSPVAGFTWSPPSVVELVAALPSPGEPDGDQLWYRFVVREKGAVGVATRSGWQDTTLPNGEGLKWEIPIDAPLTAGMTYEWTVEWQDFPTHYYWSYFKGRAQGTGGGPVDATFDQRLGSSGPSPFQSAGPVTINLANSNLSTSINTVTQVSAGGGLGASLTYDSKAAPEAGHGLRARYWTTPGSPEINRIDPTINFNWDTGAPAPGFAPNLFNVTWTGWITVPANGNYQFGGGADDDLQIVVNGVQTQNSGCCVPVDALIQHDGTYDWWSGQPTVPLIKDTPVQITVTYHEYGGPAYAALYVNQPNNVISIVPSSWLSPDINDLPLGWTLDTAVGQDADYVSATVQSNQVILLTVDGDAVSYLKGADDRTFVTPDGYSDQVVMRADGGVQVNASDGGVYQFLANTGQLDTYTPPDQTQTNLAPKPTWSTYPGSTLQRLTRLDDQIGGAYLTYGYHYSSGTLGEACPNVGGFIAPTNPVVNGMLCTIVRHASTGTVTGTTNLLYKTDLAGDVRLSRVINPGGEQSDLGWDQGHLTTIRTPYLNDLYVAGQIAATDVWTIGWNANDQVTSVTAPKANASATTQEGFTITWPAVDWHDGTTVKVNNLDAIYGTSAYDRWVKYDGRARWTGDWNAVGTTTAGSTTNTLETVATWDANADLMLSSRANGRLTTYVYDAHQWLTDTYGPANASCFTGQTPNGSCVNPAVPHTSTSYDTLPNGGISQAPMHGFQETSWSNNSFSGRPASVQTVFRSGSALISWGSGAPSGVIVADGWTTRFTGEINLNATGSWGFYITMQDGADKAALYIDDKPATTLTTGAYWGVNQYVIDTNSSPITLTAGVHRIRLDYLDVSGDASVQLNWKSPTTGNQLVSSSWIQPRLGLVTRTVVDDAALGNRITQFRYDAGGLDPALGLLTNATEDQGGLALNTLTYYDAYRRPSTKALPGGPATYIYYYGDTATSPAITCPDGAYLAPVNQGGLVRQTYSPTPATGSAVRTETVYDVVGRPVATRVVGDSWTCTTYDARGRVTRVAYPANASAPARNVDTTYSATNPQTITSTDPAGTITTTSDWLGRTTAYTDVWSNTTNTAYDTVGRVARSYGLYVGATSTSNGLEYTYNRGGMLTQEKLDGQPIANLTYTSGVTGGELASVAYPSGTGNAGNGTGLSSITRDIAGRTTGLTWLQAGGSSLFSDTVTRSQTGNITAETLDGQAASYGYDAVGRLTGAQTGGHVYRYAYNDQTNCGTATSSKNTNKASVTDLDTATGTSTYSGYCYDGADRLTNGGIANNYNTRMTSVAPSAWWRLADTGTTAADNSGNGQTGTFGGTVTKSAVGAPTSDTAANTAIGVAGAGAVSLPNSILDGVSKTYSVWFKTSSAAPGVLLSVQDQPSGTAAGSHVPMLYVGNDGLLRAEEWYAAVNPITSAHPVNDGQWHHAVLVINGATSAQQLYLDGNVIGSLANAAFAPLTMSYQYIGTGYTTGWPASGSGGWAGFNGSIDEVAIWNQALTTTQITNLDSPAPAGSTSYVYDAHGNTTTNVDQTMSYDIANRHLAITAAGTTVTYARDLTDRIVKRTVGSTITKYGSSGTGDTGDATLDNAGTVIERTINLPGGVLLTKRSAGEVWSYPNIHGDITAVANASGVKQGSTYRYSPTGIALAAGIPDNSNDNLDYGWLGQHQRPAEHETNIRTVIEMGARVYDPTTSRFLQTDPVDGGSADDYDYASGDPIGSFDLGGDRCWLGVAKTERIPIYEWRPVKRGKGRLTGEKKMYLVGYKTKEYCRTGAGTVRKAWHAAGKNRVLCTANGIVNPFAEASDLKSYLEFNVGGDVLGAGVGMTVASGGIAGIPMMVAGAGMVGDSVRRTWQQC